MYSLLLILLLLVGCQSPIEDPYAKNTPTTDKPKEKEIKSVVQKSNNESKGLSVAGLGGSIEAFERIFGKNKGTEMLGNFGGGNLVVFADNRASNITLKFKQPYTSKEQALNFAMTFSPKDAKMIKEYNHTAITPNDRKIIVFESATLAKQFDKMSFIGSKPGTFIISLKLDDKKYTGAVLGLGNNP